MDKFRNGHEQLAPLVNPTVADFTEEEPPSLGDVIDKAHRERAEKPAKRIGRVSVVLPLLEQSGGIFARALFRDMIVYRAEPDLARGELVIIADHPSFDLMPYGSMPPAYNAHISAPRGIAPRRPQDLVVQWYRADGPVPEGIPEIPAEKEAP